MLGLLKRKPLPDPPLIDHLKAWVAGLMDLSDRDTIMLAELACRNPGCVDLEIVITVIKVDRRRFILRFPEPMADVTEADVQSLWAGMQQCTVIHPEMQFLVLADKDLVRSSKCSLLDRPVSNRLGAMGHRNYSAPVVSRRRGDPRAQMLQA